MSDVRVNGALEVIGGSLTIRRLGAWFGEFDLGDEVAQPGRVTVDAFDGRASFVGHAARVGKHLERGRITVIGGAGGLAREVAARFYRSALLHPQAILRDLLRDCGEALSATATAPELTRDVPAWVRRRAPASEELWRIADTLGLAWRVLPDGTVWLGSESWADVPDFEYDLVHDDPGELVSVIDVPTLVPDLLPGRTFNGRPIASVHYDLTPRLVRATVQGWRGVGSGDETENLRGFIRQTINAQPDEGALHPASVVAQDADGTLQLVLQPDLETGKRTLPAMTGVPLRLPVPGATVKVVEGARVLVGFEQGRSDRPYAALWESGQLRELTLTTAAGSSLTLNQAGDVLVTPASGRDVIVAGGSTPVAKEGSRTTGHSHTVVFALSAGATPVTGTITINSNTDTVATLEGSPRVKVP